MSALSLADSLATIPDPRGSHGRRHPLPAVLGLVVLGLLLGRRSLAAIARLGRSYGPPLAHALGFTRGKTPSKSTLSRTLRRLGVQAVEDALSRWVGARLPPEADHLIFDGKTLKGSREGDVPGQHLVAVYAPHVQAVLSQIRVDARPTSTRQPCVCSASCRCRARWSAGTLSSASATSARELATAAAITCSASRRTSQA